MSINKVCSCGSTDLYHSWSKGKLYPTKHCKACRSKIVARKRLEKGIETKPDKYIDCDNCDHIQAQREGSFCKRCDYFLGEVKLANDLSIKLTGASIIKLKKVLATCTTEDEELVLFTNKVISRINNKLTARYGKEGK